MKKKLWKVANTQVFNNFKFSRNFKQSRTVLIGTNYYR